METPVLSVQGVWKSYGLSAAVREWVSKRKGLARYKPNRFALEAIDFQVAPGESVGVIGRNGAGKSTLLKLLAGVTPPTEGRITVAGSLFPMIELNAGLHVELTGRENARLLGAIMGMTRERVAAEMDAIERFCELGEWFDRPVRTYSSGMLARLGLGVALTTDTDILLIDEVLAVGDRAFQNKCLAKMHELTHDGRTKVFVSHNLDQVQYLCSRVIVLDRGRMLFDGEVEEGIRLFEKEVFLNQTFDTSIPSGSLGLGVTVVGVEVNRLDARQAEARVAQSDPLRVKVTAEFKKSYGTSAPMISCANSEGIPMWQVYGNESGAAARDYAPGRYVFTAELPALYMREGRYFLHFAFRDLRTFETHERQANVATFFVEGAKRRQRAEFVLAPSATFSAVADTDQVSSDA